MLPFEERSSAGDGSAFDSLAGWLECEADQHGRAVADTTKSHVAVAAGDTATNLRLAACLVRGLAARMSDQSAAPMR